MGIRVKGSAAQGGRSGEGKRVIIFTNWMKIDIHDIGGTCRNASNVHDVLIQSLKSIRWYI